jgi:hypothetical protein
MAMITIQDLQDIAVASTSDFFNNKVPLNQSLAKQASDRGLNSEQLRRAVEATNTLTHLKSIEIGSDRTSEFPVANYDDIIKLAFVPDLTGPATEVEKTASASTGTFDLGAPILLPQEQIAYLNKEAAANSRALEDARIELEIVGDRMLKKIASVKQDSQFIEHLSASSATNAEFDKLANLVLGATTNRKDFVSGMFKSAHLNEVEELISMYKEATELIGEIQDRKLRDDRWIAVKTELTKKAFFGSLMAGLGRIAGAPIEGSAHIATKAIVAPIRGAINLTGKAAKGVTGGLGKKVNNAIASTSIGKGLGMTPKPVSVVGKALGSAAIPVGLASLDAGMYEAKADPANDRSGRVWDALQR